MEIDFARHLPNIFLDFEIWFGRGLFILVHMFVNQAADMNWSTLRIVSFDVPSQDVKSEPFEKRYKHLLENSTSYHPFNIVAPRVLCINSSHITSATQSILESGGEGVIMRKCGSLYVPGRSPYLLKMKTSMEDKEAIVVGISDHKTLKLKLPNGKVFEVPASSILIPTPKIGDVVSFSYDAYARRDLPVNPKVFRVRSDVSWAEVIQRSAEERTFITASSGYSAKPQHHWNIKNMRYFMKEFARSKNLDPLLPTTWYSIPASDIREVKGGRIILKKFKGYFHALSSLFPNIGLDEAVCNKYANKFETIEKRRRFFEKYAKENNFDPQNPDNWYAQSLSNIWAMKRAQSVMYYYDNSIVKALLDLFPNIGLEKSKLKKSKWEKAADRKKYMEWLANKLNYVKLEDWYNVDANTFRDNNGTSLLKLFNGSPINVVLKIFPNHHWERTKFTKLVNRYWESTENRMEFMMELGTKLGFTQMEDWYKIDIQAFKDNNAGGFLKTYFKDSPSAAVMETFPQHKWEMLQFKKVANNFWHENENRLEYMEQLGVLLGFTQMEDWYKLKKVELQQNHGGTLLHKYKSIKNVVMEVFSQHTWDKDKFV